MSDRGFLFLFSLLAIIGGVGAAVWLVVSGQALTVDGLFLVLTALLTALVFALFVKFLVGRSMQETAKPAPQTAKAATPPGAASAAKPAPAAVSQQ